jgi:hypothetical protein
MIRREWVITSIRSRVPRLSAALRCQVRGVGQGSQKPKRGNSSENELPLPRDQQKCTILISGEGGVGHEDQCTGSIINSTTLLMRLTFQTVDFSPHAHAFNWPF